MDKDLETDLSKLVHYGWSSEDEVAAIGRGLRTYIAEQETRLERLGKVEDILNKLDEDGNTEVLKHFEVLKSA